MSVFLLLMVKDIRRRLRDPLAIGLWLGIPLGIGLLMYLAFGGLAAGKIPKAQLLVADEDGKPVASLLKGVLSQGQLKQFLEVSEVSQEEGRARLSRDQASALLVIPAGFSDDYLAGKPVVLRLLRNPAQRILPGIAENVLQVLVEGGDTLQAVAGDLLHNLNDMFQAQGAPSAAATAALSSGIQARLTTVMPFLNPPVVSLKTQQKGSSDRSFDFLGILFPGLVLMSLLFTVGGLVQDFWREQNQGTLRRTCVSPAGLSRILLAKQAANFLFSFAILVTVLLAWRFLFGGEVRHWPAVLLLGAAACLLLLSLIGLVFVIPGTQRGSNILTDVVVMLMVFLGGSLFPPEMLPGGLVRMTLFTPNGWILRDLKALQSGSVDWSTFFTHVAVYLLLGAALFVLANAAIRRRFLFAR